MKIALPVKGGLLNAHFGSAPAFRVIEVDDVTRELRGTREICSTGGGCGGIPALLKEAGVQLVIAGGIGQGAMANLSRHGIALIAGAPSIACEQVIADHLSGALKLAPNACAGHEGGGRHQHGHGHGHVHGHGHQHRHGQQCCTAARSDTAQ